MRAFRAQFLEQVTYRSCSAMLHMKGLGVPEPPPIAAAKRLATMANSGPRLLELSSSRQAIYAIILWPSQLNVFPFPGIKPRPGWPLLRVPPQGLSLSWHPCGRGTGRCPHVLSPWIEYSGAAGFHFCNFGGFRCCVPRRHVKQQDQATYLSLVYGPHFQY